MIGGIVLRSYEKPTSAFILAFIAGILALIQSFLLLIVASSLYRFIPIPSFLGVPALWIFVCGAIIFIGAVMLYQQSERHKEWGIVILIFSILGGLNTIGVVAGALAIGWTPTIRSGAYPHVTTITRVCPVCKRVSSQNVAFCPYCGTRL